MVAKLGLATVTTSWTVHSGLFRRREHKEGSAFEDWTVDGVPLRRLVKGLGELQQEATCLTNGSNEAVTQIDRLLGDRPSDFDDCRVALLVCPIDWDLHCGAITATLVIGDDTIEWRDIGWQNGLEQTIETAEPNVSITFERASYEAVLQAARTRYVTSQGGANSG